MTELIQIVTAAIGSLCFGLLFNLRDKKLIAVTACGGIGWLIFILLDRLFEEEFLCYFFVALLISLSAEILARFMKSPTTVFIAPALIPLVPGSSLYYTMANALSGNTELFAEKAIDTLTYAAALAVGVISAAVLMQMLLRLPAVWRKKHEHE